MWLAALGATIFIPGAHTFASPAATRFGTSNVQKVMEVLLAHGADVGASDKVLVALPAVPVPVTPGSNPPFQIQRGMQNRCAEEWGQCDMNEWLLVG